MRGVCEADGCKSLASLRGRRNGVPYYRKFCVKHHRLRYGMAPKKSWPHGANIYKRISNIVACSACGFVPQNACQMDRDHVNGDHSDNRPDNIQILCANCHRLKTYTRREGYFGKRVKGRT